MNNIDLRLLSVISELHRTRSVSHTAQNLGLSQSAVSMSLGRLRKHFNDPLFVRTSNGMDPTPHAESLLADLQKAAQLLEGALEHRVNFDPYTSTRMFHLCSTDIAAVTMLPELARRSSKLAPGVRIDLQNITQETPRLLESGAADLAIGLIPGMGAGFCQQKLYDARFVCALRRDHPRVGTHLSLAVFQSETHLSVNTVATGFQMIEKALEAQKITRKIGMRVGSFLGVHAILAATDYLALMPERLGRIVAAISPIKLLPVPFALPGYQITQHWHERFSLDPGQQWLRGTIAGMFREDALAKPMIVHRGRRRG